MHSLTPEYLTALRFDGTQAATLRALGEYQGKQQLYAAQSPEALKGLRQIAVVESTESSNRLEGVVVAPSRLKSLVIRNAAPKSRSEQEIAGYRDALALIHESAAHMTFNEGVVLQLHTMLYRYMPQAGGRWKATNNDIIERHPDGTSRLRFQPVAAHLTPMAMADMTRHYATALDQHLADPLVLAPLAMLDFLCIHPFPDGNGRMSRLLTLLLLYHFDYAVGATSAWSASSRKPRKAITRRWKPVRRAGIKGSTTSNPGLTTSGGPCCGPTASSRSVSAPSSVAEAAKATGCARKSWRAPCRFPSPRLKKLARA